jgi:hypothetical protein
MPTSMDILPFSTGVGRGGKGFHATPALASHATAPGGRR